LNEHAGLEDGVQHNFTFSSLQQVEMLEVQCTCILMYPYSLRVCVTIREMPDVIRKIGVVDCRLPHGDPGAQGGGIFG
jgi:hypothetical protein